ncbi:hypothetical protein ACHAXR_010855 [Thalassiosira sp. AJA248-18]
MMFKAAKKGDFISAGKFQEKVLQLEKQGGIQEAAEDPTSQPESPDEVNYFSVSAIDETKAESSEWEEAEEGESASVKEQVGGRFKNRNAEKLQQIKHDPLQHSTDKKPAASTTTSSCFNDEENRWGNSRMRQRSMPASTRKSSFFLDTKENSNDSNNRQPSTPPLSSPSKEARHSVHKSWWKEKAKWSREYIKHYLPMNKSDVKKFDALNTLPLSLPTLCNINLNHNLASKRRRPLRRLLTRIFAFIALVCYDIHNSIVASTVMSDSNDHHAVESATILAPPKIDHIHTITDNGHTNDTSTNIRISFSVHDPITLPFKSLFVPKRCNLGHLYHGNIRSDELPPSLILGGSLGSSSDPHNIANIRRAGGRILDFTTTISTNLKILHIGDSISIEIAQALDEMLGGGQKLYPRQRLWQSWGDADGGTLLAPTRGGGINGAWRITGLLSRSRQGQPDARQKTHAQPLQGLGGGWNFHQVNPFLRHIYQFQGQSVKVENIDAVIFRVMHGWMEVKEITRERVVEAAELAHSILGAKTIIFMTVPFTNNVETVEIMKGVSKTNEMIRDVARNWRSNHDTNVLVMDYAAYCNHIIWTNARNMGYNVSVPLLNDYATPQQVFDAEGPSFLLERLKQNVWPPSIPMVCSKKPTKKSGGVFCDRNILFNDGMHFCTETLSARIGSAIACLLGCVYNQIGGQSQNEENSDKPRESKIRACERQCNDQFMSVMPVKESWVDSNLASFSG